jgi:hypothetical protein
MEAKLEFVLRLELYIVYNIYVYLLVLCCSIDLTSWQLDLVRRVYGDIVQWVHGNL